MSDYLGGGQHYAESNIQAAINAIRDSEESRQNRGFKSGSDGFKDFGGGSIVKLHGLEEVLTARQGVGVADMVASALQPVVGMFGDRQAASSQSVTVRVPLIVSSRELAEVIIPVLPDLLREMRLA